jgi:NADPH:quinone reductase-like Zn-dependent oxidoreductase
MSRGVVCTALTGEDGLEIRELPARPLGAGEIRIAVRAASVNYPDVLMIRGQYQASAEPPFAVGTECAGEVVIDHTGTPGCSGAVRDATRTFGVNVFFDPVGGADIREALRSMAWGGRYLMIGFAAGIPVVRLSRTGHSCSASTAKARSSPRPGMCTRWHGPPRPCGRYTSAARSARSSLRCPNGPVDEPPAVHRDRDRRGGQGHRAGTGW